MRRNRLIIHTAYSASLYLKWQAGQMAHHHFAHVWLSLYIQSSISLLKAWVVVKTSIVAFDFN